MIWLRSLIWLTNARAGPREINKCALTARHSLFSWIISKRRAPIEHFRHKNARIWCRAWWRRGHFISISMRISSSHARVYQTCVAYSHTHEKVIYAAVESKRQAPAKNVFSHFETSSCLIWVSPTPVWYSAISQSPVIVSNSLSREPTLSFCPSFLASELMIFLIKRDAASGGRIYIFLLSQPSYAPQRTNIISSANSDTNIETAAKGLCKKFSSHRRLSPRALPPLSLHRANYFLPCFT